MGTLERLNEYQRAAVLDESEACIVNANVGSGKTTVLISKVLYLHEEKNVAYHDMVVLTFTNKAADEIRERLLAKDPQIDEEELKGFGTFHSVALMLLKEKLAIEELGFTKDFVVIDPEEELDLAMQLITEHELKIKYKNRLKKRLEKAMAVKEEAKKVSRYQDDLFELADLLSAEKKKQNKMTFSDLIENAVQLCEQTDFSPKWIIVDEVQDSDYAQLQFLQKLKGPQSRLFAVGDPNQVIYSWRGSAFNVFFKLKQTYQAKELSLPVNYRSNAQILKAAARFQQNGARLMGSRGEGNGIVIKGHYDSFQEADYFADQISQLHQDGVPYQQIAVFYRLQSQAKILEDVFSRKEIPFSVSLKKTVQEIPVLNWLLKVLRFAVNPRDYSSGVQALSDRQYGPALSTAKAKSLLKQTVSLDIGNVGESVREDLYTRMCRFTVEMSKRRETPDLYEYFQLDTCLHPTSATYQKDRKVIEELFDRMHQYLIEQKRQPLDGYREFINSAALYGIKILHEDLADTQESVKMMTLHASKGLEFTHVFIAGVNTGLIPLHTTNEEQEEEERRLFFVGMTRAKDYLELSWYRNPDNAKIRSGESTYIRMIPAEIRSQEDVQEQKVDLHDLKRQVREEIRKSGRTQVFDALETVAGTERTNLRKVDNIDTRLSALKKTPQQMLDLENVSGTSSSIGKESSRQSHGRMVMHRKYGTGTVIEEDDMMMKVEFEEFGQKEFMKAFSLQDFSEVK